MSLPVLLQVLAKDGRLTLWKRQLTHRLTHQDIGQLDMYVRMYDDLVKGEDDQLNIGVLI